MHAPDTGYRHSTPSPLACTRCAGARDGCLTLGKLVAYFSGRGFRQEEIVPLAESLMQVCVWGGGGVGGGGKAASEMNRTEDVSKLLKSGLVPCR